MTDILNNTSSINNIKDIFIKNPGITMGLSTLLATYLTDKISIFKSGGHSTYGMIYSLIDITIKTFNIEFILEYINWYNLCICIGIFLCYKLYTFKIYGNFTFFKNNNQSILNIYTKDDMDIYLNYISNFNHFYDIPKNYEFGDSNLLYNENALKSHDMLLIASMKRPADNIDINFHDTNFNVKGKYCWKKRDVPTLQKIGDIIKETIIKVPYLQIILDNNKDDISLYYDNICKKINEINTNKLTLYYLKITKVSGVINHLLSITYNDKKRSIEDLEKLYIKSFFHKKRDYIWNIVKKIQYNPEQFYNLGQIPRIGFCFYGPPGTGKSSFPYRIAMALSRHIISIDLLAIDDKNKIFEIMRTPPILRTSTLKDVIYIFDEFDRTVLTLCKRKQKDKQCDKMIKKYMNRMIKNSDNSCDSSDLEKQKPIKKSQIIEKKEFEKEESAKKAVENANDDSTRLTIEDLQEIIQGPIPLENSIIIASTNKFEEMNTLCPALFRHGRLTPIYFGNADSHFINEIAKLFFKQELIINFSNENIQPSAIIEMALNYIENHDKEIGFENFKSQLLSYIGINLII
jgi:hypothetical protein